MRVSVLNLSIIVKTLYQKALREPLFYQDYVYLLNHIIKSDFEKDFTGIIINSVKSTCDVLIESCWVLLVVRVVMVRVVKVRVVGW